MPAVQSGCDVMVEGERVPREAAVGQKRCCDPLEAAATISPRRQMQQRPPWAIDQCSRFVELELSYVSLAQVEVHSLLGRAQSSLREHSRRRVDPDDAPARCLRDRNRNAPGTDRKLDQWPVGLTRKTDVERNVTTTAASRRLRISICPRVVPARHGKPNLRDQAVQSVDDARSTRINRTKSLRRQRLVVVRRMHVDGGGTLPIP